MRRPVLAALLAVLLILPAAAETVKGLYVGEAIVTGRDADEERARGLRDALSETLIKLSGDARLAEHPQLPVLLDRAAEAVESLTYQDRLARKKLMDEQGTRQRSYLMTVLFKRDAVDQLLAALGAKPWSEERPRVLVLLGVQDMKGSYALAADGERGWGQREVFAEMARRRGLPLVLPRMGPDDQAALGRSGGIEALKQAYQAGAVLMGTMTMRPEGTWDTGWTLLHGGPPETWSAQDTTFDRAIRDGAERTARVLAGIGE